MNRRTALKELAAAGGLLFVDCGVARAGQRRAVTVRGRRIRTVDVHAHCAVPKALELMGRQALQQNTLWLEGSPLERRVQDMDAQGIDLAVLSINPNWYDLDRDSASAVISTQNEALADFCGKHADRFAAFASVALQFPELAADQLERGMKQLGLRGAAIGGSVAGQELANPKFHPFWAKAESLGAVVFIHPQSQGDLNGRLKGNGLLGNVIGNPLETTIALSHLIFEGTLDRYPGLKICAAHGGGYLPSYMSRSDHGCTTFPDQCTPGTPKKRPTEYLKQMYFDSLVFSPEGLRHLVAEVGADRIMLGTDNPYPWVSAAIDHVLGTPGLSDAERESILGGTAVRLLGLASRAS